MIFQTSSDSSFSSNHHQQGTPEVVELSNRFSNAQLRENNNCTSVHEKRMRKLFRARHMRKVQKIHSESNPRTPDIQSTKSPLRYQRDIRKQHSSALSSIQNDRYIPVRKDTDMNVLNSILIASMKGGITEDQHQRRTSNMQAAEQHRRGEENDASSCNRQAVTPEMEYYKTLFGVVNSISPSELTFDSDTGTPRPERFFHFGQSSQRQCRKEEQLYNKNLNTRNRILPPVIRHALSETDIQGKHATNAISKTNSTRTNNKKKEKKNSWKHNDTFVVILPVVRHPDMNLYDLSLARDGSYLSISGGSKILYDYSDPKFGGDPSYVALKNSNDWITCLEYCNQVGEEELVCVGTMKGDVQLIQQWKGKDDRPIWHLRRAHTGRVTSLHFSRQPGCKFVLSGGQDTSILCHNYLTGEIIARFVSHRSEIRSLSLNADESLLASCDSLGQILIWDALSISSVEHQTSSEQHHVRCSFPQQGLYQESSTHSVLWSPFDTTILMSGSMRGFITMWDIASGTIMRSTDTDSSILSMAWSRETNELITANNCYSSSIGTINIWNPKTLDWKLECDCERMTVLSLSLSDDGTTLGCIFARANQGYVASWTFSGLSKSRLRTKMYKEKMLKESPIIPTDYNIPGALVIR